MSFDIDPRDQYRRYLLNHPESDCLFEVFSQAEAEQMLCQDQCDDVTGMEHWEKLFKEQQNGKL